MCNYYVLPMHQDKMLINNCLQKINKIFYFTLYVHYHKYDKNDQHQNISNRNRPNDLPTLSQMDRGDCPQTASNILTQNPEYMMNVRMLQSG